MSDKEKTKKKDKSEKQRCSALTQLVIIKTLSHETILKMRLSVDVNF